MAGLFLSVVSVLPQLWHINQTGGVIQACTGRGGQVLPHSEICSKPRVEDGNMFERISFSHHIPIIFHKSNNGRIISKWIS